MSDHVETQDPAAPDDVRASLRAAMEQHMAEASQDARPSAEETPEPAPKEETAQEAAGRARDAQGRFARAEAPEAATDAPEAPEAAEEAPKPDAEFNKATAKWSSVDREMVGKLPPDARDFLVRRHRDMEADYSRKMQQVSEQRREYEPIHQLLEPHREQMRQRGMTPAQLIQTWYGVERGLMDPNVAPSVVANIVRGYNIDPNRIAAMLGVRQEAAPEGGAHAPQPSAVPPALAQQLHGIQSWIQTQEQQSRAREQAAYQEQAGRVQNEIENFATATDSAGQLLHPYFSDVEADMERLAAAEWASGRRPVLSSLYETAVWMNPSVRERMVAAQSAAQEAQRAAAAKKAADEARAKAQNARRAATPVTGSPGPVRREVASGDSVRSALRAALEEHRTA